MKKFIAMALFSAMCVASLAGCGNSNGDGGSGDASAEGGTEAVASEESDWADISAKGEMTIGMTLFAPMNYYDENNEFVGFDTELAQAVGEKLGIDINFVEINWDSKEQELDTGNIDCIWNGFGYTEERNKAMTLSNPYIKDKSMFVVKGDSNYANQDELKGKKIGVQSGSVQEKKLNESEFGKELDEVIGYTDYLTALMDLETGNIDAVYMSQISGNYIIQNQEKDFKTFEAVGIGEETKGMVIAFKKGNTELKDKVENALNELRAEGKLKELSEKWMGTDLSI